MRCKICEKETKNQILCDKCREEVEILSDEFTSYKRKINLEFVEHHYAS